MNILTIDTPNTLLPPAVRVAKIVGTVGASYTAGAYITHALTIPELLRRMSNPAKLTATVTTLRRRVTRPLSLASAVSSGAFSYIAYYLYKTPTVSVPVRSIKLLPGSFIPDVKSTELVLGSGWELFAVPAGLLCVAGVWELAGMRRVEKRLEADAETFRLVDKRSGSSRRSSTSERIRKDVDSWGTGNMVRGVLAITAATVGGFAVAWL